MGVNRFTRGLLMVCVILGGVAARTSAMEVRTDTLTENMAASIRVMDDAGLPMAGADVHVTYRPGSKVELTQAVGVTDDGGRVAWTPDFAGIVQIQAVAPAEAGREAQTAEVTAAVRYKNVPLQSILVLLIAGTILFGGIIWSYSKLRGPLPETPFKVDT